MLGTIVNTVAVIIGAGIGMLIKKGSSKRSADALMKGVGLCTLFLGISGSLKGQNPTILIISMVVGTLIGEGLDLQEKVDRLGKWIESKFKSKDGKSVSVAEGFITGSLLFCVGAMAIIGSLQSGLQGNHEMLFNKSVLDFLTSILLGSTLGVGVMLASAFVFVYQGAITLMAQWIAPFLSDKVIAEMTCVGSVIIIGLALNIIGVTKLKIMNYVPAIFIPMILCLFM